MTVADYCRASLRVGRERLERLKETVGEIGGRSMEIVGRRLDALRERLRRKPS